MDDLHLVDMPDPFAGWFARQGWEPHPHQLELLAQKDLPSSLLIAPTGGGKTLAGFLPSLVELGASPAPGLHTLYVSPLKALAADIRRNLGRPLAEMGLEIRVEDRTGDTKQSARARQRVDPPHILLTTPESLALLLSYEDAPRIFAGVSRVILDRDPRAGRIETWRATHARAFTAPVLGARPAKGGAVGDRGEPACAGGVSRWRRRCSSCRSRP